MYVLNYDDRLPVPSVFLDFNHVDNKIGQSAAELSLIQQIIFPAHFSGGNIPTPYFQGWGIKHAKFAGKAHHRRFQRTFIFHTLCFVSKPERVKCDWCRKSRIKSDFSLLCKIRGGMNEMCVIFQSSLRPNL